METGKQSHIYNSLPVWVPPSVRRYLDHTHKGRSLREVAQDEGCHPSTVLRQVRHFENLRDDPLVDEALESLGQRIGPAAQHDTIQNAIPKQGSDMMITDTCQPILCDETILIREARRILRRLCETGAVLALAQSMDKAVVLRSRGDAAPTRTAVVAREVAQAFVLKGWIACAKAGRVVSYQITAAGRTALREYLADEETKRREKIALGGVFEERQVLDPETGLPRPVRYNVAESPLAMLARRKGKGGAPFLCNDLVQSGERFREDFEMAQMGPRVAQNWDRFVSGGDRSSILNDGGMAQGPTEARDRVLAALDDMGPGLGDIVMRCCCFLEGLEAAEKRMGWSARSGKVVLRIALQRLHRHYEEKHGFRKVNIA